MWKLIFFFNQPSKIVSRLYASKQNDTSECVHQHKQKHADYDKKAFEKRDCDREHKHFEGCLLSSNKIFSKKKVNKNEYEN